MTEPTPPPERPLSDEARARIRSELLEHAHENRSGAPRWIVPACAAAAVALVAGLAYWAINPGAAGTEDTPVTGDGSSVVTGEPTPVTPSSTPSDQGAGTPTPADSSEPATPDGAETVQVGTQPCPDELKYVLRGAAETFTFPPADDDSTQAIYLKGSQFSLCDVRDGTTTVTRPLAVVPAHGVATYRVATMIAPAKGKGYVVTHVAGGRVPDGTDDFAATYTFPDGTTEQATTATDDQGRTWWRMIHTYDDDGGNQLEKPEIEVTVTVAGAQEHYTLAWGDDTCAQANHGC